MALVVVVLQAVVRLLRVVVQVHRQVVRLGISWATEVARGGPFLGDDPRQFRSYLGSSSKPAIREPLVDAYISVAIVHGTPCAFVDPGC